MPVKEIMTHYRVPNRKRNFEILKNAGIEVANGYADITFKQMIDLRLAVPRDAKVECTCDDCGKEFCYDGYHAQKAIDHHDGKVLCRICAMKHTFQKHFGRDFYINSDAFKEKSLITLQEKHGSQYTHPMQVTEIKEKARKTSRLSRKEKLMLAVEKFKKKIKRLAKIRNTLTITELYEEHASSTELVRNRVKRTVKERYGSQYDSVFQVPEVKRKIDDTIIERYGSKSDLGKLSYQKCVKTLKERYGEDITNAFQVNNSRELIDKGITAKFGSKDAMYEHNVRKIKQTIKSRYGDQYDSVLQVPEVKEKCINTWKNKYGKSVVNPGQAKEVRTKIAKTLSKNYRGNYTNSLQIPEVRSKCMKSLQDHYGQQYTNPSQVPEIREKQIKSRSENGSCALSSQQKHLHNLLGGELNYPFKYYFLDIAFPNEKIYIEYNGGGHNLSVKAYHTLTQDEFDEREMQRYFIMKTHNWKLIKLIAPRDKLLSDDILMKIVRQSKKYLRQNHHSINVYLEEDKITCSQFKCSIEEFLNMNFV